MTQQKIDDSGPAFPVAEPGYATSHPGMSTRMWLAGMAMQGLCSTTLDPTPAGYEDAIDRRIAISFDLADAMIAASRKDIDSDH